MSRLGRRLCTLAMLAVPLLGVAGVWWCSSANIGMTAAESVLLAHSRMAQVAPRAETARAWMPAGTLWPQLLALCEPEPQRHILARGAGAAVLLGAFYLLLWRTRRNARGVLVLLGLSAVWLQAGMAASPAPATIAGMALALWSFTMVVPRVTLAAGLAYVVSGCLALWLTPAAALLLAVHGVWLLVIGAQRARRDAVGQSMGFVLLGLLALAAGVLILWPDLRYASALSQPPLWAGLNRLWAMIAALSVSQAMPMAPAWWCLAAGVALVLILVGARCIAQGRPAGGSAALYLLVYLCMQGWLCATAPGRDILRDTWQLLPALMVLAAEGIGAGVTAIVQWAGGRRMRIWRYAALTLVWAAVLAAGALWLRTQAHSLLAALCGMADHDVTAPATFLRHAAPHDALLMVQLAGDVRVLPQTRYTLAALLAARPAACIKDVAPGATPAMPASARTHGWWHIGGVATDVLARLTQASGGTNVTAPFVIPVTYVSGSNAWTAGDTVRVLRRAAAAAPLSRAVYVALLAWYRQSNAGDVQAALASGDAMDDLAPRLVSACAPAEYRAALNSIIYAWSAPDQVRARQGAYALFHRFVSGVDRHALDRERVAYIYRLYLEQALTASNTVAARAILQDARAWDARDPYYDRLEAGLVSLAQPTAYARMRALNTRAARRYVQRHGRPFFDALFANVLLAKAEGATAQALRECHALRALLRADARSDHVATNAGATAVHAKARRDADRLFWEAQCNSYIALLMMAMGDYANGIVWQTKNLDERFDAVRHRVSYERLASMYLALGDVTRALRKYEELATVSTTAYERLYWMLQATQINVTYGDAVAVFDQWAAIERMLEHLSNEDRHRWSRDKQLQRVLRYVQRRLNVDVRDVAETMLLRNIANAEDAAWRYRQVAQLQRCRLQYERAAATYAQASALTQAEDAVYLDAAMLAYQRQQYARAIALVSNLSARATSPCAAALTSDWRYAVLALLHQHGKPPGMDDLLRWVARARPAFSSTAAWRNARGNIYTLFGNFAAATNEFALGIAAQPDAVENYLDLGYLYCIRADAEEAGRMLDRVAGLYPSNAVPRRILQDWRTIELYHVSIRPYVME